MGPWIVKKTGTEAEKDRSPDKGAEASIPECSSYIIPGFTPTQHFALDNGGEGLKQF